MPTVVYVKHSQYSGAGLPHYPHIRVGWEGAEQSPRLRSARTYAAWILMVGAEQLSSSRRNQEGRALVRGLSVIFLVYDYPNRPLTAITSAIGIPLQSTCSRNMPHYHQRRGSDSTDIDESDLEKRPILFSMDPGPSRENQYKPVSIPCTRSSKRTYLTSR
jgi:hypothetical protein